MAIEHDTPKSVSHFVSVHGLVVGLVRDHQNAVLVVEPLYFSKSGFNRPDFTFYFTCVDEFVHGLAVPVSVPLVHDHQFSVQVAEH